MSLKPNCRAANMKPCRGGWGARCPYRKAFQFSRLHISDENERDRETNLQPYTKKSYFGRRTFLFFPDIDLPRAQPC